MKTPNLLHGSGSRPLTNGLDLFLINMDPLSRNDIPQKDHLRGEKVTLFKVAI